MQELLTRARGELRHEPLERRVRAHLDGEPIVDSTRAMLVWEPRRVVPSFAVPVEDIRAELSATAAATDEVAGVLHPGIPFAVHSTPGEPVSIAATSSSTSMPSTRGTRRTSCSPATRATPSIASKPA